MKKTVARLSALPLRHKIAAAALTIAVIALGGSGQISGFISAFQQGAVPVLRKDIFPSAPGNGKPDYAQQSGNARDGGSPTPEAQGGVSPAREGPALERIALSNSKPELLNVSGQRSREETLLGLTIAQLDQKTASLEQELLRSRVGSKRVGQGAQRQSAAGQLSALRKQRLMIWDRLREARSPDAPIHLAVFETARRTVSVSAEEKPAAQLEAPAVTLAGPVLGVLGLVLGVMSGVLYLGISFGASARRAEMTWLHCGRGRRFRSWAQWRGSGHDDADLRLRIVAGDYAGWPWFEEGGAGSGERIQPSLVIGGSLTTPITRDYQEVALNLLAAERWPSGRIFVSSPGKGDGKTCTAFNLAWALGKMKKSVLLVELNFEQPQFRRWLGDVKMRYGLDSAVLGSSHPAESVFSLESKGFDIAAVRDAASPERVERILLHLKDFLDWGSENYELLVLDCPSILSKDWDRWLNEFIGPTLLVVREEQTPLVTIDQAVKRLGENLKGFMLNDSSRDDAELRQ